MDILTSTHPLSVSNIFPGNSDTAAFRRRFGRNQTGSTPPEKIEESEQIIHVAVGKSLRKGTDLLNWVFRRFGEREIGIIHVHQPSSTIPTLLGKLPASHANEELLSSYRREEKEQINKMLLRYLNICYREKVQASITVIEAEQVQKGIVELVTKHGIRRLVMGAAADNCMKANRSSSIKASYTAKNAPQFCEICFIYKGRLIWTRNASEGSYHLQTLQSPVPGITLTERQTSNSLPTYSAMPAFHANRRRSCTSSTQQATISTLASHTTNETDTPESQSSPCFTSTASGLSPPTERRVSSEFNLKEEPDLDILNKRCIELRLEADRSKQEAFAELLVRKRLESEAAEAINKVNVLEAAYAREAKLKKVVKEELKSIKEEQEKLLILREEMKQELENTIKNTTFLESQVREVACRSNEATRELKVVQTSLGTLRRERKKIQRQKKEPTDRFEAWKNFGPSRNCDGLFGFVNRSFHVAEFSLSDLQSATCDFSESFKIGQVGHGCVYKGEIMNNSVAIKKFHPHNMQGQLEFQQEVQVLSKLRHPRLVSLIGTCFEAWCLVYEYFPNGTLQNRLFYKTSNPPLTWKIRIRIISGIASALLFLHSSKPEKIFHGDLKPGKILLDSEFNCKICDFGNSRLIPVEATHCPSFQQKTEPKGLLHYTDPEFCRTEDLTSKSDVYSFGVIVLQLLTGRPPVGLEGEVRRAVSSGRFVSLLDQSAGEWSTFAARRLAEIGLQCCEINSRDRPELTPVMVRELELLHLVEERTVPPFFMCPILQELMHDPQLAADGFTYEGEAIQRWLDNGCKTSPMTNLELKNLNLIPNHALRNAIQDWLCQS